MDGNLSAEARVKLDAMLASEIGAVWSWPKLGELHRTERGWELYVTTTARASLLMMSGTPLALEDLGFKPILVVVR